MTNLGTKIGEIPIEKFYDGKYVEILKSMEEEHGFKWSNKKLIGNNTIRKGATSANKDELLIIPLNMRDGSLICIGKGNEITAQEGTNIINLISPNKPIATTNFIRLYGKYLIDTGDVVVQDKKKSRKIYKFK